MSSTCRTCRRTNPPEASFCYYDGVALDGALGRGPVAAGAIAFPTPFVLPSGRTCRTFDELVLACDSEWSAAKSVLQQGFLENFLGGLGRIDLAMAARQSAKSPDIDRGLDELLNKLPSSVREPAKLEVKERELFLGVVPNGTDRRLTVDLKNLGMGLLQGTVSCTETPWLALGDAPSIGPQKMFHCRQEMSLPVQVIGKALRANAKPQQGKLVIESNGGVVEIVVNIQVPITPFPHGVLAGAKSPRQVAEKAKAAPKDAAALFANGDVAAWYASNGWIYPVQGPPATGLGAVQQFFEALGLVAAPKVTISTQRVNFRGTPGSYLEQTIQVQTVEKRPVFAYAVSQSAWAQIGAVQLRGQLANIPIIIPSVPSMPGEELHCRVDVSANGNQRFTVDVAMTIVSGPPVGARPVHVALQTMPASGAAAFQMPPPLPGAMPPLPGAGAVTPVTVQAAPFEFNSGIQPIPVRVVQGQNDVVTLPTNYDGTSGMWKHLVLLLLLLLGLGGMWIHDAMLKADRKEQEPGVFPIDPEPYIALQFHDNKDRGKDERFGKSLANATMRFGLVMTRDPDDKSTGKIKKKLTYSEYGITNNTCLRIDGKDYLFGDVTNAPAKWVVQQEPTVGKDRGHGVKSIWEIEPARGERIVVTQTAEIRAGEPVQSLKKRRLDTCLILYEISNQGKKEHKVGIRFLLDTFIGARDGVPFTIPGRSGLCDTKETFPTRDKVPDFIAVQENDSLDDRGTVARLRFRLGSDIEVPDRLLLGGWPDEIWGQPARGPLTLWDVPEITMKKQTFQVQGKNRILPADSAVTLYWNERSLKANESRKVGFTYGLGPSTTGKDLVLEADGRMSVGSEFTLTASVLEPGGDEKLTLTIPDGLTLSSDYKQEQPVPPVEANASRKMSTVTWKLKANKAGGYELKVKSNKGKSASITIHIRSSDLFN